MLAVCHGVLCLQAGKEDGIMTSTLKIGVEVPLGIFLRSRCSSRRRFGPVATPLGSTGCVSQTNGAATFCVPSHRRQASTRWGLRKVVAALCQSPSAPQAPPNANICFAKKRPMWLVMQAVAAGPSRHRIRESGSASREAGCDRERLAASGRQTENFAHRHGSYGPGQDKQPPSGSAVPRTPDLV